MAVCVCVADTPMIGQNEQRDYSRFFHSLPPPPLLLFRSLPFIYSSFNFIFYVFFFLLFFSCACILSVGFVLKGFVFFCFGCPSKPFPTSVICEKGKCFASLFEPNVFHWMEFLAHIFFSRLRHCRRRSMQTEHCSSHTHTHADRDTYLDFLDDVIRMLCGSHSISILGSS